MKVVMPLKTRVIDSETDQPVSGAKVLRIVCDVHDFDCNDAYMDTGATNRNGEIELDGKRKWGVWMPVPGGLPAPNHQIAIWKEGYQAFVFSAYDGDITKFEETVRRADIRKAIKEIPKERNLLGEGQDPNQLFSGGEIKLYKAGTSK